MNSRGKKVMDIEWSNEGVTLKIPVKAYAASFVNGVYLEGKGMKFRAEYKEAGIDLEDTDINKLQKAVKDALDQWYTITWELFFLVTIDGGDYGYGKTKFSVEYEVEFFVVGKDSRGKVRHMRIPRPKDEDIANFNGKPTQWGLEKPVDGEPQVGVDLRRANDKFAHQNTKPLTKALVRATPESVRAAEQFAQALQSLLAKMHHHFAPDKIEALLKNTSLLLPAPKVKS